MDSLIRKGTKLLKKCEKLILNTERPSKETEGLDQIEKLVRTCESLESQLPTCDECNGKLDDLIKYINNDTLDRDLPEESKEAISRLLEDMNQKKKDIQEKKKAIEKIFESTFEKL